MEHRCNPRLPTNVKILIYRCGVPMAIGWLRNVSRDGFFIASDCVNVGPSQLLEIEFIGGRSEVTSHKRCRALVAYTTAGGFGLAIDQDCATSCGLADELLVKCRRRRDEFAALFGSSASPVELANCG